MIRKMDLADVDRCVSICELTFRQEGYSFDVRREFMTSFSEDQFIKPEYFVYEQAGLVSGVGGLNNAGFDDVSFGICTCYVLPELQNRGIGRSLTEYRIQRIKYLGGRVIFSTTKKHWHLKRFGFKVLDGYSIPSAPEVGPDWKMFYLTL